MKKKNREGVLPQIKSIAKDIYNKVLKKKQPELKSRVWKTSSSQVGSLEYRSACSSLKI